MIPHRPLLFAAGLLGATGVALSAAAAHAGGDDLAIAARFLLIHAPAFLALSMFARSRALGLSAYGLLLGVALFCGDLLARHFLGTRLFPYAAPAGGLLMIAGWMGVALSAVIGRRAVS